MVFSVHATMKMLQQEACALERFTGLTTRQIMPNESFRVEWKDFKGKGVPSCCAFFVSLFFVD
jgi:hypothetical protein